jgi:hypothetical protein
MTDWAQFNRAISWFLHGGKSFEVGEPRPWDRAPVDGLPVLSALLAAATVTPCTVEGRDFELLAWGPADERRGWLCRPPELSTGEPVTPVHRQFWQVCGGIVEDFGGPSTWWDNQDQILTVEAARESVAEPLDAYKWIWENDGLRIPIDPAEWYPAAIEANANLTLAHRADGRLLLFAPDHDFDRVTPYAGSPELSLLSFDDLPDLTTWIEVCAAAWRDA